MKFQDKQQSIILANILKSVRLQKSMSREQLSETSGVSAAVIIAIESGVTTISLEHLIALCKGLGCSLDFVVGNSVQEGSLRDELLKYFDTLDVEQQGFIVKFVAFIASANKKV
jgi:transcriptional regulator with XRE-family HTH domain